MMGYRDSLDNTIQVLTAVCVYIYVCLCVCVCVCVWLFFTVQLLSCKRLWMLLKVDIITAFHISASQSLHVCVGGGDREK